MLPAPLLRAFEALAEPLTTRPEIASAARALWRAGGRPTAKVAAHLDGELPLSVLEPTRAVLTEPLRDAALELSALLPMLTYDGEAVPELGALLSDPGDPNGTVLFAWMAASTWRRDTRLAPLLAIAATHAPFRDRVAAVARDRVVEGPLVNALSCAPFLGDGDALLAPANLEARARLEILVWEAGAAALPVPELGRWIWSSASTFEAMVHAPARGTLRGRVLAARTLEIAVGGLPPDADPELVGRTLQVLQPLLLHPEPLVWVHAARALGRLTGALEQMEGTLLDWVLGSSPLLRQRALTAFASLPASRLTFLATQLVAIVDDPAAEPAVLAAAASATPYLFFERRDLWDRLAKRVFAGHGGAVAARALARGLATLWRRGDDRKAIEPSIRALRELARAARAGSLDDLRRWIEVIAVTDVVDGAERDPLDLELGLENLVRLAAQYDDEEADARAARFAIALAPSFHEARRIVLGDGRLRQRAAAVNALEGAARSLALRLWGPLLATAHGTEPVDEPDLAETWKTFARAPSELLDLVKERRAKVGVDPADDVPLEVLAVRLGGYALDACGEDAELGPGRGPTAHATCLWLRKLEGLVDGSRELPHPVEAALATLLWRLVDTTRGSALGEVEDARWLGPFAAWWALVIDRPAVLLKLATALPMIAEEALASCCAHAQALRSALEASAADGSFWPAASEALEALYAGETELGAALAELARALESFQEAAGPKANLDALCLELVLAGDRLHGALGDPVKALHAASAASAEDSLSRSATENAPRVAGLVARAVRARDLSALDVWLASLGPVSCALLEAAVRAAIGRTPPPPPAPKKKEPTMVAGYELVKHLGEGGVGKVWLVKKPGADRLFVLKTPKQDALQSASETEREGILASFVEEAKALAGLYHPNVANIIDRGVVEGVPYLVLEYLLGADLKQYASARPMTLFELRQVVLEASSGLAALHGAGLVHRDIKPANLWLRLPLGGGARFEPDKHRDPAHAPPLSTVVIDFGMVRAIRVPAEVGGRFVAGTAGYIAPEQVLDPVELDPRSDVYALAGTIYNVTTGRTFFDDVDNPRDRILAHMKRDPFEDEGRLRTYPEAIAKLLRAATAMDPADRPTPLELAREFASAL